MLLTDAVAAHAPAHTTRRPRAASSWPPTTTGIELRVGDSAPAAAPTACSPTPSCPASATSSTRVADEVVARAPATAPASSSCGCASSRHERGRPSRSVMPATPRRQRRRRSTGRSVKLGVRCHPSSHSPPIRSTTSATSWPSRGEIDLFTAPELKAALGEALESGQTRIVVDLTDTSFLDSTALGVLIGAVKRLRSRDGVLTIVNTDPNIAKTFEITGLDQIFTIRPTRDEAVEALDADEAAGLTRAPSGDQVEDGVLDRALDRRRVAVLGDAASARRRSSGRRGSGRTPAGRCRTRGRPPACCRGSGRPP